MRRTIWLLLLVMSAFAKEGTEFPKLTILATPAPLYSHWVPMTNIAKELAARGHELKYLYAADEEDCANKLSLPLDARLSYPNTSPSEKLPMEAMKMIQDGRQKEFASLLPWHFDYCKGAIDNPDIISRVKAWKPDLVLLDGAFPTGAPVGDVLDLPKVVVWVIGPIAPLVTAGVGTPDAPSLMPPFTAWQKQPMGFIGRLKNVLGWGVGHLIFNSFHNAYDPLWNNYGMPTLSYQASLQKAAAAILQSHFAAIPAIPLSPHVHVLGSLTAKPAEALPGALAQFCAQHPEGVLYLSTGTSATPDVKFMQGVNQILDSLNVPAIWKLTQHDQKVLKQHNVTLASQAHVVAFAPQNDLLGSGCVKAFVTQGGSNSFYEALHHGVPMVILPLLVEQPWNAAQAAALGFGIHIDLPMPTQPGTVIKKLGPAVKQILQDNIYTAKAQHISRLMQAERWTPVEQAASVVEHAGWTNGSMHNHMLQHRPSWIALHMIDVAVVGLIVVVLVPSLTAFAGLLVVKRLVSRLQSPRKESSVLHRKQQ